MSSIIESISTFMERSGFSIITLIFVAVFGLISVRCILKMLKHSLLQTSLDKLLIKFVMTIAKIFLYVLLLLYCFTIVGIPLTGAVTALSAITLAIGLAIQDIIAGVASGMMLVAIHPFKVGDFVEADGNSGSVKEVNLFHTVLTTSDNKQVMIPNKNIFSSEIVNYSYNDKRRLDIIFGADYDCNHHDVIKVIKETAEKHPLVLKDPAVMVRLSEFKDSEIAYLCRVWVMSSDYWTVKFDLQEQVLDAYAKNGLEMAYPQITLSYREKKEAEDGR
ncbi:MAG: mechanosensitive ion channel family protein [Spirochaetales bacterium]|nr:mechanosensitive ion channel family protein [Spirochaetales bacterium]